MRFDATRLTDVLPGWKSASLSVFSATLLTLSFPDFDLAPLAWFGLVPLMVAVALERESALRSLAVGWLMGTLFFFGTCWWLTFAPITYAGVPWWLAYLMLSGAALVAGLFVGLFAVVTCHAVRRLGDAGIFSSVAVWPAAEFLRYWITGNSWNAVGYSQAFNSGVVWLAAYGGVYMIGALVVAWNAFIAFSVIRFIARESHARRYIAWSAGGLVVLAGAVFLLSQLRQPASVSPPSARITVVQPDVPMDGMNEDRYSTLLALHFRESSSALKTGRAKDPGPLESLIVFPESPMLFRWSEDAGLRELFRDFASATGSSLLFNSAEPSRAGNGYLNSAVMVDARGRAVAQYDKIFLLPFGEFMPLPEPLASWMPAFVGSFESGSEYDVLTVGEVRAGVMICFESHFASHTSEFARRGADVIIEMTNDGYLGRTPVLRQHLANSVMRAAETRRPVVRATNVGVTALINEAGEVLDEAPVYTAASRSWTVSRSDGVQTPYVRFGDWFAWLCSALTLAVLSLCLSRGRSGRS